MVLEIQLKRNEFFVEICECLVLNEVMVRIVNFFVRKVSDVFYFYKMNYSVFEEYQVYISVFDIFVVLFQVYFEFFFKVFK